MNLLVDMGNTRIKWALTDRLDDLHMEGAPYPAALPDLLEQRWSQLAPPRHIVVASVAGAERVRQLKEWVAARWGVAVSIVEAQRQALGVRNSYGEPHTLGSDRWAALIAAWHLNHSAACIIDCGTAVTVDALSAGGEFLGGVILPGLALMRASLLERTAGIRTVDGTAVSSLARSTAAAVAAGTVLGLTGAVERILDEHQYALGEDPRIFLTGGDAGALRPYLRYPFIYMPDLVLRGLAVMADAAL